MNGLISLITLLVILAAGLAVSRTVSLTEGNAARRLHLVDEPVHARTPFEIVGSPILGWVPRYFHRIEHDLYWAYFSNPTWASRTPAWIAGRQMLSALSTGALFSWLLHSPWGLWIGLLIGWMLMQADLTSHAENIRHRISQELPEFLQMMAAESASGTGLETVLERTSRGEGMLPTWLRRTLALAHGRSVVFSQETGPGILLQEAQKSGHADLISFALQLGFARTGSQVRETLTRLAAQFTDDFIGKAEIRTERLGNTLGLLVALFYFLPFLVVILFVVGVPVIQAF